ncbi:hypothetical protein BDV93DRAFT_529616, partial [Ceratobasidium sp. AG-I]
YVWVHESEIWPPLFRKRPRDPIRKRGTPTAPDWTQKPEWSQNKPTKKWARRCVDRWHLLPPYDTQITEKQWESYYEERYALDKVNTIDSDESEVITPEELEQNTWKILRSSAGDVAATVFGSSLDDEERKKKIARTLLGSLYFIELAGSNEEAGGEPDPRNLDAETRLYSPFGIGTSIDFHYDYHFRLRHAMAHERNSGLSAVARTIDDCSAETPLKCAAVADPDDEVIEQSAAAFVLFERTDKHSEITSEEAIRTFEEPFFGCTGWLSSMKLADLLLAAGTVTHYNERDMETPQSFQDTLYYFHGENKGKRTLSQELTALSRIETLEGGDEEMCVPLRCLLLAAQGEGTAGGRRTRRK